MIANIPSWAGIRQQGGAERLTKDSVKKTFL